MEKFKIWIIVILLIITVSAGYLLGLNRTGSSNYSLASTPPELNLTYKQIVTTGINGDEQKKIEEFIDQFEGYLMQRDSAVLDLFTPPANKRERDDLDFIIGKDLPADNNGKVLPRLFTTQGFSSKTAGYYVREIHKEDLGIKVAVDEMRVIYSGGEDVGYTAKITNLVVELTEVNGSYKVTRYYQSNPSGDFQLKYQGLMSD